MNNINDEIAAFIRERYAAYPPILEIPLVAKIFQRDVATIRARIERDAFPITVRGESGEPQHILLSDLIRFELTGERQPQLATRFKRKPRNPQGMNGKRQRGAPTKAERIARENSVGA